MNVNSIFETLETVCVCVYAWRSLHRMGLCVRVGVRLWRCRCRCRCVSRCAHSGVYFSFFRISVSWQIGKDLRSPTQFAGCWLTLQPVSAGSNYIHSFASRHEIFGIQIDWALSVYFVIGLRLNRGIPLHYPAGSGGGRPGISNSLNRRDRWKWENHENEERNNCCSNRRRCLLFYVSQRCFDFVRKKCVVRQP